MLFLFPLLIVCMFEPFFFKKNSNLTQGKETYPSMRTFALIKQIFYFSSCFGQILFALSDFRTCLKARVVSRDTLTRSSTLSDVLLTFSGSFVYA